jgi:hypothetical protein
MDFLRPLGRMVLGLRRVGQGREEHTPAVGGWAEIRLDCGEVRIGGRNPATVSRKERFHLLSRIGWVRPLDDFNPDLPISV